VTLGRLLASVVRRLRLPDTDDLDRELGAHLELEAEEQRADGLSPRDAARAAHRLVGNRTLVKEEVRQMSLWIWWERLVQDLRYGLRGLRRSPAFAITAVVSLALGIGANTAIFSVTNAVMMRSLPVSRPDELVVLRNGNIGDFSFPVYQALRDGARTFSAIMAASNAQRYPIGIGDDAEQVLVKMVSGNYFSGLDVTPVAGRMLTPADELEPVAVLSHGYWVRRFGSSLDAVGRPIRVNGVPLTIVGVARASFSGEAPGEAPDVWTSLALQSPDGRNEGGFTWLNLLGRLGPGATIEQARADLAALRAQIQPAPSADTPFREIVVEPGARGSSGLRNRIAAPLIALMAASAIVLVIACLNLGGLLLTRDAARESEIAMRLAIGATAGRVVRQLMTESLLIAACGGALGLAFAYWCSRMLLTLVSSAGLGLSLDAGIDRTVLVFASIVSAAAAVLFGLAPSFRAVRRGRGHTLTGQTRVVGRERRWGLRASFVVAQIALSLVLLTSATMFIRTLRNLETQDLGFARNDRLIVGLMRERGYRPDMATLLPRLVERLGAIQGVAAASVAAFGTLSENGGGINGLQAPGFNPTDPQARRARANWVGPKYFEATAIPLVSGRDLQLTDDGSAQKVAVVNETTARHLFGSTDVAGRRFTFNKNEYEIVGVAKDTRIDLRESTPRLIYFAILQGGAGPAVVEVRTSREEPAAVARAIRAAIADVDPRLSASEALTLESQIDRRLSIERLVARLSGFLSGLTLLLVCVGIYGTLAFTAARRTKEIGLRLALGSSRATVVWIVLRDVVILLAAGIMLGAIGVFGSGQLVATLLYRLEPMDPVTIGVAVGLLVLVATVAGSLPALRASRLDPARVLRE